MSLGIIKTRRISHRSVFDNAIRNNSLVNPFESGNAAKVIENNAKKIDRLSTKALMAITNDLYEGRDQKVFAALTGKPDLTPASMKQALNKLVSRYSPMVEDGLAAINRVIKKEVTEEKNAQLRKFLGTK